MIKKIVDQYKQMAKPVRAGMWFTICNVIPQVITVIMTVVFTRILSTDDYGLSSNYAAWYSIVGIFITLSLNGGVYNNAMLKYEHRRDEYTSAMIGLSLLLGGLGLVGIILFRQPLSNIMGLPYSLLICLGLQCLLYNPYGCWVSRVKFEYNYKALVIVTILISVLSPLLAVGLISVSANKAVGKVWGQNLIYLLVGFVLCAKAIYRDRRIYNREFWKYALRFNVPLIPHYLSLIILNQSDRVMITSMCGTAANGLYSVAYSAASLLLILNSGITQALTPWCYGCLRGKQYNNTRKYLVCICGAYALLDLLFVLLAPEAIRILAGEKYAQSVYVIPPVAASMYLIFLYNIYSIFEFYHEKTKPVMVCSILSAGLNIILNFLMIPRFGYLAAGYTTLACYIFNALMHSVVLRRIENTMISGVDVAGINPTLGIGLGLCCLSVVATLLYPYTLIRWMIVGCAMAACICSRKRLIRILKKIKEK